VNDPDYDDSADDWHADKMLDLSSEAASGKRMKDFERLQDFPDEDYDAPEVDDKWGWLYENNKQEYSLLWEEWFESEQPYCRFIEPEISKILRSEWQ
jgi:hypothetical protein